MKVKVLQVFRDKNDRVTMYQPGEIHDFEDDRAKDLCRRGLAKAIKAKTVKK